MMRDMITTAPPGGFKTGDYVVRRYDADQLDANGAAAPRTDVDLEVTGVDDVGDTLIVVAHGLATGRGPLYVAVPSSADALPMPIAAGVAYWAIVVDADTIQLAASKVDALAASPIDIIDVGLGAMPSLSNGFAVAGSVQALGSDKLRDLGEGQSTEDMRELYTVVELRSRRATNAPDVVELDGKHYRVNACDKFGTLSGGHFVSEIEKLEIP